MATAAASSTAVRSLWSRAKSVPVQYPFAFGVVLSGFKTSFSDLLVQKVVERREEIDWKRNSAFATFGFFYLGGVQYGIYVKLFGRMFPGAAAFAALPLRQKVKDTRGIINTLAQVFLDQCVHHPLMYFPVFYCTREVVMSEKPDFSSVLRRYRENMSEDMVALWKVWVPSTLVNFAFMPMHARIPFVAMTSLVWTCILSAMRGGDVAHADDMAGNAVTGATLKMFEEGLQEYFTCPVELDRGLNHIVVTASGPDATGLVATLARTVATEQGNVTISKMVRLGQEFIVLMHISVPPEKKNSLVRTLKKSKELKPLNIRVSGLTRRMTGKYDKAVMGFNVHCVGQDQPGMLALISEKLTERGLLLEDVSTQLRMGKTGRRDFVVDVNCTTAVHLDHKHLKEVVADISTLKNSLQLDVLDVRVHKHQEEE